MSEQLPNFDLPQYAGQIPSTSAYQCPNCGGIAYNPVCPYCEENEREES